MQHAHDNEQQAREGMRAYCSRAGHNRAKGPRSPLRVGFDGNRCGPLTLQPPTLTLEAAKSQGLKVDFFEVKASAMIEAEGCRSTNTPTPGRPVSGSHVRQRENEERDRIKEREVAANPIFFENFRTARGGT